MDSEPYSTTRFEIDARRFKLDWPYIMVLAVSGLCMLGVVCLAVWIKLWFVVVLGVVLLLPLVVIPFTIRYSRVQTLDVSPGYLTISWGNRQQTVVRIERGAPLELTLEYYDDGSRFDSSLESTPTLNLWDSVCGHRRRHVLGWWISNKGKTEVFDALVQFLVEHGFELKAHNDLTPKNAERASVANTNPPSS